MARNASVINAFERGVKFGVPGGMAVGLVLAVMTDQRAMFMLGGILGVLVSPVIGAFLKPKENTGGQAPDEPAPPTGDRK